MKCSKCKTRFNVSSLVELSEKFIFIGVESMEFLERENKIIMVHAWEPRTYLPLFLCGSFFSFCVQIYQLLSEDYINYGNGSIAPFLLSTTIFGLITLFIAYLIAARKFNKEIVEISSLGVTRHTKELFLGSRTVSFTLDEGERIDALHIDEIEKEIVTHNDYQRVFSDHNIVVHRNGSTKKIIGSLESKSFAITVLEALRVMWNVPAKGSGT